MSGHSKWAQIKRKKALTDAKKGKLFSKLSKLIEIAAKKGSDIKTNITLKTAVEQAKEMNMPAANIDRAVKKGSGLLDGKSELEEVLYEAYGPGGVAILITGITSNKNRTVSEIKHILNENNTSLSGAGSVKWMFDLKFENGEMVWIPKQTVKINEEDENKMEVLMEALEENEDVSEVYTNIE